MHIHARPASSADLDAIWAHDLAQHDWPIAWRDGSIRENESGMSQTFVIFNNEVPIGCGTLCFSPECSNVGGHMQLADGASVAHLCAFRIDKPYRGCGHVSRMVKQMEAYAHERGYTQLTIGAYMSKILPHSQFTSTGATRNLCWAATKTMSRRRRCISPRRWGYNFGLNEEEINTTCSKTTRNTKPPLAAGHLWLRPVKWRNWPGVR